MSTQQEVKVYISHAKDRKAQGFIQLAQVKAFFAKEKIKVSLYRDVVSRTSKDRKGLDELLSGLEAGDIVAVTKESVLSKDPQRVENVKRLVDQANAVLVVVSAPVESSHEEEDVDSGSDNESKHRGRPAFGYMVNKETGEYVVNDQEQAVIALIRAFRAEYPTLGLSQFCELLTEHKVKIRKSARIYPTAIKNICEKNDIKPGF